MDHLICFAALIVIWYKLKIKLKMQKKMINMINIFLLNSQKVLKTDGKQGMMKTVIFIR